MSTAGHDALALTENVLRELIEDLMRARQGADWMNQLGIPAERVEEWKRRRDAERKKRAGVAVEERLLWYSDWFDLERIFKRNWHTFDACFPSQKRFEVYMERLSALRNPDSHSRTLMPYELAQIDGMTGEIRQQVTVFRSGGGGGPEPEHFPRIELVTDSFGNIPKAGARMPLQSGLTLRPGDRVSFNGSASDPDGDPVAWDVHTSTRKTFAQRQEGNDFAVTWHVDDGDIGEQVFVYVKLRGTKPYHRMGHGIDDQVIFMYQVLPRRR